MAYGTPESIRGSSESRDKHRVPACGLDPGDTTVFQTVGVHALNIRLHP